MAGLEEPLNLDLRPALASVGRLDTAFAKVADSFGRSMQQAVAGLRADSGTLRGLTSSVEGAIDAADTQVTVTGEARELTPAVEGAIDAADTGVEITAEAARVTGAIDAAVQAADTNIEVTADVKQATSAIADTTGKTSLLSGAVGGLSARFGGLASTATLVKGGIAGLIASETIGRVNELVQSSSNLNEAVNLIKVVFEAASNEIDAFARDSARSIGLSRTETLKASAAFGGLFVGLGKSRQEAAGLSIELLTVASDLSSAKNLAGGTQEAIERLTAGIVGEIEPLRRLGVNFNAAQVEQKAFELGLQDARGELTEGAKASARYAIILEQLGRQGVLGDFQRTAKDLANSQRTLTAEWEDGKTELGQGLLPVAKDLVGVARDLIPLIKGLGTAFGFVGRGISQAIRDVKGISAFFGELSFGIEDAARRGQLGSENFKLFGKAYRGALENIKEPARDAAGAVGAIGPASELAMAQAEVAITAASEALREFQGVASENLGTAGTLFEKFADESSISISKVTAALNKQTQDQINFFENVKKIVRDGGEDVARQILALGPLQGAAFASAAATAGQKQLEGLEIAVDKANAFLASKNEESKLLFDKFGGEQGQSYSQAFINSIVNQTPQVEDATSKFGDAAVRGLKGRIRATSPSKVTFALAEDFTRGFVLGLENTKANAQRAAADLFSVVGRPSAFSVPQVASPSIGGTTAAGQSFSQTNNITVPGGPDPEAVAMRVVSRLAQRSRR